MTERVRHGTPTGIRRRKKQAAFVTSVHPEPKLEDIFEDVERIRSRVKRRKVIRSKALNEKGRT